MRDYISKLDGSNTRRLPYRSTSRPSTGSENIKATVKTVAAMLISARSQPNSAPSGMMKSDKEPNANWPGPVDIPTIEAPTTHHLRCSVSCLPGTLNIGNLCASDAEDRRLAGLHRVRILSN